MSLLDQFADDLSRAGDRRAVRSLARRRRVRIGALAIGGALAFGGVAAAAAPLWHPLLGDDRRGRPTTTLAPPPPVQLQRLAVLRREQTPADRGPTSRYALAQLSPRDADGVRLDFVRTIESSTEVVLIPTLSASGKRDALCLFVKDAVDGGAVGCFTTSDLLAGRAVVRTAAGASSLAPPHGDPERISGSAQPKRSEAITLPNPASGTMDFYGIVPDGVVRVELGDDSAAVHDNVFHLRGPESLSSQPIRRITSARAAGS